MNKNCIICDNEGKYKCPTCLVYYCSVACCKTHRETKCEVRKMPEVQENEPLKIRKCFLSDIAVEPDKLQLLRNDEDLNKLLANEHLRNLLSYIDKADNPDEIMQKAMLEPLFVEFADACLRIVEPQT